MYYLVYGFLYIVSLLPRVVLYAFGDGISFLIYNIIGYRKKVVLENLRIAFPGKKPNWKEKKLRNSFTGILLNLL